MYLFQIMDFYAASGLSLLWICFFETIAVSWFYGAGRFSKNIEQMLGHRPALFIFWHYCWLIFAPVVMGVRIYFSSINVMFSRSGSQLSTMTVARRIVLTQLTKRSTILAVFKNKFGRF